MFKLFSRKTQTAISAWRRKWRASCRRRAGTIVPKAEILDQIKTADQKKLSVKDLNLEKIIDMQSWCKTWQHSGSRRIRAKPKLLSKPKGACKSSWSQIGNLKSFTLTIFWNLAKPVKIFPGIIERQHHTDQKQMRLLKEQQAEWKKVHLRCCCNQIWTTNGGRIPWRVIPICETFKISCLMGRDPMRGGSEYHSTDHWYRLEQCSNITPFRRKTYLD